jgi:hypothetical protein
MLALVLVLVLVLVLPLRWFARGDGVPKIWPNPSFTSPSSCNLGDKVCIRKSNFHV